MDRGEKLLRQEAVVGHGIEHARLAQKHHQHDAGKAGQRAQGDDVRRLVNPRSRNARAIGASMLISRHGTMPVRTRRDSNVQDRADQQRSDDADGQVALRILGLLRRGGDGIEADVGEKYVRSSGADAGEADGREGRPVRTPIGRVDVVAAQADNEQHDGHLNDHDRWH